MAFFMNVTRGNPDSATAVRILALPGSHDSGTIRADQPGLFPLHCALYLDHVVHRNAFSNANYQIESGVHSFKNGVSGERRWHKNSRRGGTRLLHGFGHRVKDGNLVFELLSAFARSDACDNLRSVRETELSMPGAKRAGDALNEQTSLGSDEDGH